jgi:OmpA-OmpF porin, OOP family
MKNVLIIILSVCWLGLKAQVTDNPKIKRKSSKDVFITKIEILPDKIKVDMYFVGKTANDALKEYLKENPEQAEQLRQMDPMMRSMILKQMQSQTGESSISYQPSSYLRTSDGKKYKFLSAVNIPEAPKRLEVAPGKRHNFTVYFEKIPKGFELIDIIEHKVDKSESFSYWNFSGIKINNPAKDGQSKKEIFDEKNEESILQNSDSEDGAVIESVMPAELRLFGKVKDLESGQSLSAKVKARFSKTQSDSLQTSKSGTYEFIFSPDSLLEIEVSAPGYATMYESVGSSIFRKKSVIQRDILLEKIIEPLPENKKEEKKSKQNDSEKVIEIGERLEHEGGKDSFKLDKVYFEMGKSEILPESFIQLDKLIIYLQENPELKIQVEGHTDNQGDATLNQKLSLDRAYKVREYLVAKGINSSRIKFIGLGSKQPLVPNTKEENKRKNRRVEYRFF